LSALAAVGEIGHEDWQTLRAHLEECASCRGIFADVGQIQSEWLPEHPDFEITRDNNADLLLRQAILKQVTKAGARFSKAAQKGPRPAEAGFSLLRRSPWLLAAGATVTFIVIAGVWLQRTEEKIPLANTVVIEKIKAPASPRPSFDDRWKQKQVKLEEALRASEAQRLQLQRQLEEAQKRTEQLGQSSEKAQNLVADLRQQLDAAHAAQVKTETELTNLRTERNTSDAVALLQEREIQALNQTIMEQSSSVDHERELLSAGREIRDLIAARNLHIIDVYDTDSRGKTQRAFGRVFYTEGKSLVFYAYDLSDQHPENNKYAFYVWGRRDGVPQMAKSLGAMAKDDAAQKRWILTITDPNVLAEIDSVFVTLEPAGQAGGHPSGKRLLTAFLGTAANHP
jgi:hypothetical protein